MRPYSQILLSISCLVFGVAPVCGTQTAYSSPIERSSFAARDKPATTHTFAQANPSESDSPESDPPEESSPEPNESEAATTKDSSKKRIWWMLGVAGVVTVASGFLYLFLKISRPDTIDDEPIEEITKAKPKTDPKASRGGVSNSHAVVALPENPQPVQVTPEFPERESADNPISVPENPTEQPTNNGSLDRPALASVEEAIAIEETTRLPKINIVDALIQDLQNPDPAKRRKAIWELGQRGDSRAIQPLVDLMIDSDSSQRSLILAVLSEIGTRTLKPMNRALAVSLQDDSAEVRKNAIRDLTRIYDIVAQMSQLLNHAIDDSDREVSDTAQWALSQLNRIRTLSGRGDLPTLPHVSHPSDRSGSD
ncbi:MAG: HEAT repeat domain-containing protein [Cyanobacteriota bacterium]|nr:HEAT repeat domain-containing protein [Cyanobacteriota bacterium]